MALRTATASLASLACPASALLLGCSKTRLLASQSAGADKSSESKAPKQGGPASGAAPMPSGSAAPTGKKKSSLVEPLYVYSVPGSSIKEPAYGVSISDPDVIYYDPRSPSTYTSTVHVGNPARHVHSSQQSSSPSQQMYVFSRKPSLKEARYFISLSDPVFRTENDTKN